MNTLADFLSRVGKPRPAAAQAALGTPIPPVKPPAYWNQATMVVWQVVHTHCAGCDHRTSHTNPYPMLRWVGRRGELHEEPLKFSPTESERIRFYPTVLSHLDVQIPRCHECLQPGTLDFEAIQGDLFSPETHTLLH